MRWALFTLALLACSDAERTTKVLADEGFTNIRTTGHAWMGCAKEDTYCTGFEATSPSGKAVHGVVGCGTGCGKGCTVRFQ